MAKDKKKKNTGKSKTNMNQDQALKSSSRQELVEIAKGLKVKNYSRLSKVELLKSINKLTGSDNSSALPKVSIPERGNQPETHNKQQIPIEDLSGKEKFAAPKRESGGEEIVLDTDMGKKDFGALSRQELVDIAKRLKIKNYSRLNKTRLIKLILEAKANTLKKREQTAKSGKSPLKKAAALPAGKKISLENEKTEPKVETDELNQAVLFERISQHLLPPYVDERDSKSVEAEMKTKFLLRPSRFPKGKINKEYLLEDEKNLKLPELYEENTIVLLPVDPYRIYTYWNLNRDTLRLIEKLNLQQLVLKINDVTGIIYNGKNANHYWFESCLTLAKNWYIYLLDGDKNLNVELGYVLDGLFYIIATSNTIYVPRRYPSPVIQDRFVIVSYPEAESKRANFAFLLPSGKETPYFGYGDQSIAESYNTRRLSSRMPVFNYQEKIPGHFAREYEITGRPTGTVTPPGKFSPPPKLPVSTSMKAAAQTSENTQQIISDKKYRQLPVGETFVQFTREEIPQTIREQFEYFSDVKGGRIIVDRYYYEIPGQAQKIIKVTYHWYEDEVPFRKEIYWTSDLVPKIHEKIYKISWGPAWVKEFIGGSERIRFLGASERFLGASEQFLGGSEMFLGASGRFMGASEFFQGGSERFMGASEIYLGGPERFMGGSERFLGGSEQYLGGSEQYLGGSERLWGTI